jgi:Ca-activated chloride channel family protein
MSVFDQALEDRQKEPDRFYSIVLMTDGKNTVAPSLDAFENYYMQLDESMRKIRIFPIFFGEANEQELERIAALTGGRLFDGNKKSLPMVFKEIRGYQ